MTLGLDKRPRHRSDGSCHLRGAGLCSRVCVWQVHLVSEGQEVTVLPRGGSRRGSTCTPPGAHRDNVEWR